jgi:hypothetical protein
MQIGIISWRREGPSVRQIAHPQNRHQSKAGSPRPQNCSKWQKAASCNVNAFPELQLSFFDGIVKIGDFKRVRVLTHPGSPDITKMLSAFCLLPSAFLHGGSYPPGKNGLQRRILSVPFQAPTTAPYF